jgi:hypothetical protein
LEANMPRTEDHTIQQEKERRTPQQIAQDAAEAYFDALGAAVPCDGAPGDVNLVEAYTQIYDALAAEMEHGDAPAPGCDDVAMHAGYLLGVEVGRRLGGVR